MPDHGGELILCQFENGRCVSCGRPKPKTDRRVVAVCRGKRNAWPEPLPWAHCVYRGEVLAQLDGTTVGCGCGGSRVEVYACAVYQQPVIRHGTERCLEKIQRRVPGYAGIICSRNCERAVSG